jgi:hypothetical protein
MLKLVSKFVLEVLPPACAVVIGGVLLFNYHALLRGAETQIAEPGVAADGPVSSEEVAQRIEAEHAALLPHDGETQAKPPESKAEPKLPPKRPAARRPHSPATPASATASSAAPAPEPAGPTVAAAAKEPGSPTAIVPVNPEAAIDVVSNPEPKRLLGVPIPASLVAIGSKLNPAPVLRAGEKVIDQIVVAAKSVVPDFSK